jgi:hypothetical protein
MSSERKIAREKAKQNRYAKGALYRGRGKPREKKAKKIGTRREALSRGEENQERNLKIGK